MIVRTKTALSRHKSYSVRKVVKLSLRNVSFLESLWNGVLQPTKVHIGFSGPFPVTRPCTYRQHLSIFKSPS